MKVTVNQENTIQLEQVYNPITLVTDDQEKITICMRDSGFEFFYGGVQYSAQKGEINKL